MFCAVGALDRVFYYDMHLRDETLTARDISIGYLAGGAEKVAGKMTNITTVNDVMGHAKTVAMYEAAIEIALESEANSEAILSPISEV